LQTQRARAAGSCARQDAEAAVKTPEEEEEEEEAEEEPS